MAFGHDQACVSGSIGGDALVSQSAQLLNARQVIKPWGRRDLPAPFELSGGERIGEIWFEHESAPLDLLVKYLFTSEKLSIQVHPSDELGAEKGLPSGKEECWLVLDAEPGAALGIGTREPLTPDQLRVAALDGSLEQLMDWKPVSRGDFYYIPAGTVHAIGAGVTLVEIQQNADITYRLFDYGRPRELHLEDGLEAAAAGPYPDDLGGKLNFAVDQQLVAGPKFDLWLGSSWPTEGLSSELAHIIPLAGSVSAGCVSAKAGECLVCAPRAPLEVAHGARLLIAQARK